MLKSKKFPPPVESEAVMRLRARYQDLAGTVEDLAYAISKFRNMTILATEAPIWSRADMELVKVLREKTALSDEAREKWQDMDNHERDVQICKHLEEYPDSDLSEVVANPWAWKARMMEKGLIKAEEKADEG